MATPHEPTPPELGRARYRQVEEIIRAVVAQIQAIWATLSAQSIEDELLEEAGAAIADAALAGQLSVAQAAQAYIAAQMAAQGGMTLVQAQMLPNLVPSAFTGFAPGGGPLESLLYLPAIGVRRRLAAGLPPEEAMIGGLVDMTMYASTAIADAARSADQVAMTAHPQCVAYVRVVQLPACSRCIILAGQMYRHSEGFLRHPRCDCQTLPLREDEWPDVPGPRALFDQLDKEQQQRTFTVAGARAIRQGGDIGQVVNARRGMSTANVGGRDVQVTSEGITRRGIAGARLITGDPTRLTAPRTGGDVRVVSEWTRRTSTGRTQLVRLRGARAPRLMPEEIFRVADGDRDEELRLLRRNGYIV
ncbi:hypothetical protein [Streptomyces albogriseolus]|uniref:hypothetical protein n=1 Tax=Streptomyces albogriseolus TaxID=1887 RepID=UPI003CFB4154